MTIDKGDRIAFISRTHITFGGPDMHRWHRLGSLIVLICLLVSSDRANAGRFSISLGYGVKQIDGTHSFSDGEFDITAPPVSHIVLTGPS